MDPVAWDWIGLDSPPHPLPPWRTRPDVMRFPFCFIGRVFRFEQRSNSKACARERHGVEQIASSSSSTSHVTWVRTRVIRCHHAATAHRGPRRGRARDVFDSARPTCDDVHCRKRKARSGLCEPERAPDPYSVGKRARLREATSVFANPQRTLR